MRLKLAHGNEIVSKLEPLIDKSSQVSLEGAVSLSMMPPHDSEPLVNVLDEERYVTLALQNAHSAVTSKCSWHTLSRSTPGSSSRTTQLRLGTITTTTNPCFVNVHRVSCDSSGTSLGNWFQEGVCHIPPKVENFSFHSLWATGEGLVANQDCNA